MQLPISELSEEKQLELALFQSQLDINSAASKHAISWRHDSLLSRKQLSQARRTHATAVGKLPQLSEFHQQAVKEQTRPDLLNAQQRALLDKFAYSNPLKQEPFDSSQPVMVLTKQQV